MLKTVDTCRNSRRWLWRRASGTSHQSSMLYEMIFTISKYLKLQHLMLKTVNTCGNLRRRVGRRAFWPSQSLASGLAHLFVVLYEVIFTRSKYLKISIFNVKNSKHLRERTQAAWATSVWTISSIFSAVRSDIYKVKVPENCNI